MRRVATWAVLAAFLTVGCGKSEEQKAAEKAAEDAKVAAAAIQKAAESAAAAGTAAGAAAATQGLEGFAKAMEGAAAAMAGKGPDGKPVEPSASATCRRRCRKSLAGSVMSRRASA